MNTHSPSRRLALALSGFALAFGSIGALASAASAAPPVVAGGVLAAETTTGCTVSDATLEWGVIERWRAYISGTIANGGWTLTDGVAYETPAFAWSAGSGTVNDDGSGEIAFNGTIHFAGHEELLKVDLGNPTLELVSPSEGYLLLDLASTKPTGEPDVSLPQVRAIKLDLAGALVADGTTLTVTEASGRLTAEGASAFGGFYAAGEEVDPISMTASAPGCVLEATEATAPPAAEDAAAGETEVVPVVAEPASAEVPWLPIGIGVAALLVIGVSTVLLLRGGKSRGADPAQETTVGSETAAADETDSTQ